MNKITAYLIGETIASNDSEAHSLHKRSHFGEPDGERIQYSLSEALYLVDKKQMEILSRNKVIPKKELLGKLQRLDRRIAIKYPVFKSLRSKGHIVKTALKFGADFRVYEKGSGPGKKHAKWVVFVEHESKRHTWHEFTAKTRVAHSTKKHLLLAIVDEEGDITYYEVNWIKP